MNELQLFNTIVTTLRKYNLNYNTSYLEDYEYSSLALREVSLNHLETNAYDSLIKGFCLKNAVKRTLAEKEKKSKDYCRMAFQIDHLAKFHKMTDAKEMWDAIKSRFGGNDESKKMQKYILKQQFEGFSVSNSKGLHKGYDRFQSLLSQLETHGAGVSTEDANQKLLSFDDLYNNLRVFESDVKGSTASSSNTQNVAFISSESTNGTNDASTAYGASPSTGNNSQRENSSSYTDDLMYSFFANQSTSPKLKKFYKQTGRKLHFDAKEPIGFNKTKVECYNCHKTGHFARECRSKGNQDARRRDAGNSGFKAKDNGRRPGKQEEPKAMVTIDGEGIDWTAHAEDEQEDFALMAFCNSASDSEVITCSKQCVESYTKLKKLYDEQREQLNEASIEIQAHSQGLKKVEAQLVTHKNNQLWYEEKIKYMTIDLDDKTNVLTYHKKLLAEALKERDELKTKFENWQSSSKNLGKLLTTQMSANDKFGLGYGDHRFGSMLSYENEVLQSVFMNKDSSEEDSTLYDRFVTADGMHAVPPPMTGNYMPIGPDVEIDESKFTYGPKQSESCESDTRSSDFNTCESESSVEILECLPEQVVKEPKVVGEPKVWSDAPIIEEYESDCDDDCMSSKEQEQPSFANTSRENITNQSSHSQNPKIKDLNGSRSKRVGLGYGFTRKRCFVCGSFSHLIKDCDYHEKRMAKQDDVNKKKDKGTGNGEKRPVRNNVKKFNHQNQIVPRAVLTRTGKIPVNTARTNSTNHVSTARQNSKSQAVPTCSVRKVNSVSPKVNEIRPKPVFHKVHSQNRRPFYKTTAPKANFSNQKVNTVGVKAVSAVGGKRKTAVKASTGIVDSGCSRHMTCNKAFLVDYEDYNGGPVTFGGSKGQITGKGKIQTGKLDFEDVCYVKELQ
ncbi:ribonuclease H-like domain-containing protein [Tanacetum coccineum]